MAVSEWLVAHNVRRKEWHRRYGKSYVPLEWSNALKAESKVFAQKLLRDSCGGLYHGEITTVFVYLSCLVFCCVLTILLWISSCRQE